MQHLQPQLRDLVDASISKYRAMAVLWSHLTLNHQVTLNQGMVEAAFSATMSSFQVHVGRPVAALSLQVSTASTELADPDTYPAQVGLALGVVSL